MKAMAIFALMVGAFEVMNSLVEVRYGLANPGGSALMIGAVGTLAGASLLVAAIALLRGTSGATTLARAAAYACLAVFGLVAIVSPLFSILATLLGVGFPIALILFFVISGRRGGSSPTMA